MTDLDFQSVNSLVSIDDVVAGKAIATVCVGNRDIRTGTPLLIEHDEETVFATAGKVKHCTLNAVTARNSLDCGVDKPTLETVVKRGDPDAKWSTEVTVVYFEGVEDPGAVEADETEDEVAGPASLDHLDFFSRPPAQLPPTDDMLRGLGIDPDTMINLVPEGNDDDTDVVEDERDEGRYDLGSQ